ncbi:MAG: TetR/AcrR family transcriptional regulator [Micropruina sp.]
MAGREGGYASGRLRREQIITAATELFARVGYRHATIVELAGAAGISRTGLLHHFGSKETLLKAVLERQDAVRVAGADADDTGLGALGALVELARHNAERPRLVALFAALAAEASDPDHPAHEYFVARYRRTVGGIAAALRRAKVSGVLLPDVDPAGQAQALVALIDGLQVQWLLSPSEVDMAGTLRTQLQNVLSVPLPE